MGMPITKEAGTVHWCQEVDTIKGWTKATYDVDTGSNDFHFANIPIIYNAICDGASNLIAI